MAGVSPSPLTARILPNLTASAWAGLATFTNDVAPDPTPFSNGWKELFRPLDLASLPAAQQYCWRPVCYMLPKPRWQYRYGTLLAALRVMTKTFVAINDPVHSLIRGLTRQTPLCPCVSVEGVPGMQYHLGAQPLPEAYYSLAAFHALGGLSLRSLSRLGWRVRESDKPRIPSRVSYFDAVRLDRRCARDLRRKPSRVGPGMLAGELLTSGVGTLRARNDDPFERVHWLLWSQHGRIETRHEIVYATIRALHRNSMPLLYKTQKESFDSTNVIYGDAYGEVEQLWERRADTSFLGAVAEVLQRMARQSEVAAFLHPPLNLAAVTRLHIRSQAIWKSPPASGRALLRRVEYVLANTVQEDTPQTRFRRQQPEPASATKPTLGGNTGWRSDRSGYDGWLAG